MRLVFANEATAARRRVYFHVVDATDGITAETGEAAGQPQVSSDGAAFTNTGIGTLTHLGNGRYYADLTQTLVATAGVSIETRYKSAATAETPGDSVQVVAFNPYSTSLDILLAAANLSTDTITAAKIASDAITAAKIATGAITSAKFAAGAIDAAAIATDAIDADAIADNAINAGAIATGAITAAKFAAGAIDAAAIASDAITASKIATDAITASKIATDAIGSAEISAAAVDKIVDAVWDELIAVHLGAGSTGAALNGATAPTAAVVADAVWDEARAGHVAAGSFGEGVASVQGNVTGSVASVTGNVGGNVTGSVGSVAAGGIAAASFAAGAIDAAAIATDAIGSAELAASAVTEIQSGLATAAALATVQADTDDIQTRLPAALVSGRMDSSVGAMAADVITAAAIATDAIGSAELAASAVNEIADQVWDELIAGHLGAGSTGEALANAAVSSGLTQQQVRDAMKLAPTAGVPASGSIDLELDEILSDLEILTSLISTTGTSDSGTTTTMVDAARTEADTDYWKGAWIKFTSGTISGQTRLITGFDPGTDTITFTPATTQTVGTQTYVILAAAGADLRLWNGTAPNNLISGRVDSSVGAMAAGVVTAAAVATDAIDADAIAASAVTEIQSGLATAAALATVQADTDDIQTRLPAALVGGRMDSSVGAIAANAITAAATDASFIAEINAEVDTALADLRLDEVIVNAASPVTPTIDSFWDRMTSKNGSQTFDRSTDSLEAIADSGSTPPSAATIADAVWDELLADHVTANTMGANQNLIDNINSDTDDIQTRLPAALVGGRMDSSVGAMAADVVTAAAIATDAIGSAELAASAVNEIADQVWDELRAGHVGAGSFGEGVASVQGNVTGSVASVTGNVGGNVVGSVGSVTGNVGGNVTGSVGSVAAGGITAASIATNAIDADALATDAVNEIVDQVWEEAIADHSGTVGSTAEALSAAAAGGAGLTQQQVRDAMKLAPTAGAPAAGSVDLHLDDIEADTQDIQGRLPATLVGGRIRSHVEAMDAGVITAAVIATDAFDADALAANAVTEIQAGLATAAALAVVQADTDDIQTRLPAALVGGRMDSSVGAMAAGVITATAIATDAIDADALAASALAEINTEIDTALADIRLDELIQNAAAPATPTINSFVDRMTSKDGTQTYDRSTDSLEGISDALVAAGPSAATIADAVWDEALADHVAVGSMGFNENLIDDVFADTNDIQTRLPAALVGGRMDSSVGAMAAGVVTAAAVATGAIDADALATDAVNEIVDQVWEEQIGDHSGTVGSTAEALDAAASGGSAPSAAVIADAVWDELLAGHVLAGSTGEAQNMIDDILTDTAAIQPLVDVAVSTRATPAQVNTEVDTALSDIRLDELIFNVAAPITPTIDSFIDRITSKNGAQTYDRSTDSLEAASDAIVAAGPSAAIIADAVWDEALAGHLTVGSTGAALDAIGDDLDTIMGPGFSPLTDSLEEIRDEVDACCGVSSGGGEVINIEGI